MCRPYDVSSGCAVALLCVRCGKCFCHCTCVPSNLRAVNPERTLETLRHSAQTRTVPVRRSICSH